MSTEEKVHYKSLISFLKYTITITGVCLTIIISVGIYFTYSSLNQMKDDIRIELKETKNDINNSLAQSRNEIKILNDYASSNVNEIKDIAENTLTFIKQDAKNTAIVTSKAKVEETFKENNIQELIENTAKNEISAKINQMIQDQIQKSNDKLVEVLDVMPDFMLAIDKFRFGNRNGLVFLDSIQKNSNNSQLVKIAEKIIQKKKLDYTSSYSDTKNKVMFGILGIKENKQDTTCQAFESKLKYIILNDDDLTNVFYATTLLSKCLGKEIELFDFDYIRDLK